MAAATTVERGEEKEKKEKGEEGEEGGGEGEPQPQVSQCVRSRCDGLVALGILLSLGGTVRSCVRQNQFRYHNL